ncbi:micrococcal nuclease [Lipomyces oligophaga]|uniref:micrococcal nuclease n=1 Tax=Lipomyces oligophaga TaxID=45792 RepID=UPI0034CEB7B6
MGWWWSKSGSKSDSGQDDLSALTSRYAGDDDKNYSIFSLRTFVESCAVTTVMLGSVYLYSRYLKRFPTAMDIPRRFIEFNRPIRGRIVYVGDGDNFRLFHTPGGMFAGWNWLRRVPYEQKSSKTQKLSSNTISVRLCGVDAPEAGHFGNPAQEYSAEARQWLTNYVVGRRATIKVFSIDQYHRAVAKATIWTWTGPKDVSAELLRAGFAIVYEGHLNTFFGSSRAAYETIEASARRRKVGMWESGKILETPGMYKHRIKTKSP